MIKGLDEIIKEYEEALEKLKEALPDVDWTEGYEALEDDESEIKREMTTDYYMPYMEVPKAYPTPLEMVKEYYKTAGITPDPRTCLGLVLEEQKEFWEEVSNKTMAVVTPQISYNPEDELKELADLVYAIYQYANARGWDLDEKIIEVHCDKLKELP